MLNFKFLKKKMVIGLSCLILVSFGFSCLFIHSKTDSQQNSKPIEKISMLNKIDELQASYFKIIKRNDILLLFTGGSDLYLEDKKELRDLYKEVESSISKNNYYLKKYQKIKKDFKNNPGKTTVDMNNFAAKHYEASNDLLNEIYNELKNNISPDDFEKLEKSELLWQKEVKNYYKVFERQGFGTIGTLVYYYYENDMINFRTLLLISYLQDATK